MSKKSLKQKPMYGPSQIDVISMWLSMSSPNPYESCLLDFNYKTQQTNLSDALVTPQKALCRRDLTRVVQHAHRSAPRAMGKARPQGFSASLAGYSKGNGTGGEGGR